MPAIKPESKTMGHPPQTVIDVKQEADAVSEPWRNWVLASVNDHVVRVSVMREHFHFHSHSNTDEVFFVFEGGLYVDFEDRTVELKPGQMIIIPRDVVHRTRPVGERVVTITFEHQDVKVKGS